MRFTWSFSSLKKFETCPRQWEWQYVHKQKEPETDQMREGTKVHEALAARANGTPLPAMYAYMEKFGTPIDKARELGWAVYTEQRIGVSEDMRHTEFFAPDVWLRVVLDSALVGPTYAVLSDYKTGSPKYVDETQLQIFAGVGFIVWPNVQTISSKYLWTTTGGQTPKSYQRDNAYKDIWEPVLARVAVMRQGVEEGLFPPKRSWACKRCPVTTCPYREAKDA